MQTVVGDLVYSWGLRLWWVMPDAEGGKDQGWSALSQLDAKDHAELAIRRREAQLHAMSKGNPIRPFLVAGEKTFNRHPLRLELSAGRKRHLSPRIARPPQILSEGSVIEQRRCSASPLVAH
jgi:hypothetical protein